MQVTLKKKLLNRYELRIGKETMLEELELKGLWWLPDNPDLQLPGTLTFSQSEGAHLEVVGVFGTDKSNRIEQPPIILGITQDGKSITLRRCHYRNWSYPLTGLGGARYFAHIIFDGVHFETEEEIRFNRLMGNYTDLDAWVDVYGFKIETNIEENKRETIIHYSLPESNSIDLNDRFEVGIVFSSQGPKHSIIQTEAKISQRVHLVVNSKTGDVPFEELFTMLDRFSDLLQLAIQRTPYPVTIQGLTEANEEELEKNRKYYPPVQIYFQPIEAYSERKDIIPHQMLFTYKDLDEHKIRQWFESFDVHEIEIKLHRALFYAGKLFIDTRFLFIAQALESLHSRLFTNNYLPTDEFRKKRDRIIELVEADDKEWVLGALSNANYKRFKEKILELLESKTSIFNRVISDNEEFSNRVRDTRNEFVHHRKLKRTFRDKEELHSAIQILIYLFEAFILELIGFSEEQIQAIFKKRIDRYLSRWKKF